MKTTTHQGNTEDDLARLVPGGLKIRGRAIRIARMRDEWYETMDDPAATVTFLRGEARPRADLFTFIQRMPDTEPSYDYPMEWDNVAAIPLTSFDHWWKNQIPKSARKHIRRSERAGVTARLVSFDDELAKGIHAIYNESPLRQGRPFSHYADDLETIKKDHQTFSDRRDFVGAYLNGELIGMASLIYTGKVARSIQLITRIAHRDKWPTNVLLAKSIEVCAERGMQSLVYGKADYGPTGSAGIQSFKHENGFEKVLIPRYWVPLTNRGRLAFKLNLHCGLLVFLPRLLAQRLVNIRRRWYERRFGGANRVPQWPEAAKRINAPCGENQNNEE